MNTSGHTRRRRTGHGPAAAGGAVLLALILVALAAPLLSPEEPGRIAGDPAEPPGARFWLGTNALGQDLFSHLLYGARTSLLVGFLAACLSTGLSAAVGISAGMWRRGQGMLMALVDLFLALPQVPLIVLMVVFWGPGFWSLVGTLALIGWAAFARVVRAQVSVTLRKEYVEAARALGASEGRVLRAIVLMEVAPILFTKFLLTVRWAVLMEATLGLLGLADPGRVSWGLVLHQAFGYPLLFLTGTWIWWAVPPAIGIVVVTVALMAVGQDVDLWLNPAMRPPA